jgi:hypothetical protein
MYQFFNIKKDHYKSGIQTEAGEGIEVSLRSFAQALISFQLTGALPFALSW